MYDKFAEMTSEIVCSFVESNKIASNDLPALIKSVYGALNGAAVEPGAAEEVTPVKALTPAQVRKSITPNGLISFEDGKSYKTLKRHLSVRGMTPADYRAKWGLPADYPIVAPAYSQARSAMAVSLGLGRRAAPVVVDAPVKTRKPRIAKAKAADVAE